MCHDRPIKQAKQNKKKGSKNPNKLSFALFNELCGPPGVKICQF